MTDPTSTLRPSAPSHAPISRTLALAGLFLALLSTGGCAVGALIGGMAASAERSGSKTVKTKYTGLMGKSFAVIVAADRSIQADHPEVVEVVTNEVTRRLVENSGATGVVPAPEVLRYQFQNPGWVARTPKELADEFGVQRLVFIDLQEYSLTDPGNAYVWAGVAGGLVQVLEADSPVATEFAYKEAIRVRYPDESGMTPSNVPGETVRLELTRRLVRRASWLFYEHDEPNIIKY